MMVNWYHCACRTLTTTWVVLTIWLLWWLNPFNSRWSRPVDGPNHQLDAQSGCGIHLEDLYYPSWNPNTNPFCSKRGDLLRSISGGGRIGFDAPFIPKDCYHRWYSVGEICMIFERFEAIVFVGDEHLQAMYAGLNILLRKDYEYGALVPGAVKDEKKEECKCDNQFIRVECSKNMLTSSEVVLKLPDNLATSRYACERIPHALISISGFPAPPAALLAFRKIVKPAPLSVYKSIPIVFSLTTSYSVEQATKSLDGFLALADATKRKTPMLWIGPPAAGHLNIRGRVGNQEVWQFSEDMARAAAEKDIDVMGMWNMTVQANSYDGKHFGEKVAITQAMMIANWLSRLPSS